MITLNPSNEAKFGEQIQFLFLQIYLKFLLQRLIKIGSNI